MSLSSLSDLYSSIYSWTARTDLTAVAPDCVKLAESHIRKRVRTRSQLNSASGSLTGNTAPLPNDFLEVRQFLVDDKVLQYVPEEVYGMLQEFATDAVNYTLDGDSIKVAGGGTSTYRLDYYSQLTALSAGTDTNWLLTNAPDVYLWASLAEAYDYLQDDSRLQKAIARRDGAISELNLGERLSLSAGPMKVRPDGYTP